MNEMQDTGKWYEDVPYQECKSIIKERLTSMSRDFISVGYYLKYIRDKKLYKEDGYASVWEFAESNYGIKMSTASRWMAMNDKFSQGGNIPLLDDRYRDFGKSQLQEMLYLNDEQMEQAKPDMPAKEIRAIRKPVLVAPAQEESESIDVLEFSTRVHNVLKRAGIDTVERLLDMSDDELAALRNFSKKCLDEVHNKLEAYKTDVALEDTHEKEEVQEVLHFTVAKEGYGAMIAELIGNYLDNAYTSPDRECEASVFGQTYKVLKRPEVTVFYTADGRTFFDVENIRLKQEYQWRQKNKPEPDIPEIEETEVFAPAQQEPEQIPGEVIGFEEDEEDNLTQEWPELLVDIPVFDERTIKDFLLDEERDLEEYLKVDGLPFKVLSRKQMTVAGLRLLLGLVRGEDEHE